jgi:hypothetical protein
VRAQCDAANCSLGRQGWSAPQHSACRRSAAAGHWPILALALKTCSITALPTPNPFRSPLAARRTAVTGIRGDFQSARYDRMAASLPALIATAIATRDHADGQDRAIASTLLADAYITAASFMVKRPGTGTLS